MSKKVAIIIAAVLFVMVAAGAGYFFWNKKVNSPEAIVAGLIKINSANALTKEQNDQLAKIKDRLMIYTGNYDALFELALLKQSVGDQTGAIVMYQDLNKKRPKDILPMNNLAAIYYDQGRYEDAEAAHLKILNQITPKWLNSYNELYSIYQFHLKNKRADYEKIVLNGIKNYEENEGPLAMKAAVYYDELMGDYPKAIEYYEKALKLLPDNKQAAARLGELEAKK